jgi:SAM-dependent methyltransferase
VTKAARLTTEHRDHFDRISGRYQAASDSWGGLYEQVARYLNPLVEGKVVLDVGNGGRFAFDTSLPAGIIALDVSPAMLERITDPRVVKVVSDAQDMEAVAEGSIDVVCCQLVLHHITGESPGASVEVLERVIASAFRRLRPGGRLVIVEALLGRFLYAAQVVAFPAVRLLLRRFGVSMIFFFRQDLLRERMARAFSRAPSDVQTVRLRLSGWIDPLGGSFPGVLRVPAWLQPWDFRVISVTKP